MIAFSFQLKKNQTNQTLDVADVFVYSPKLGKSWRENTELLLIPRLLSPSLLKVALHLIYRWFYLVSEE